LNIHHYQIERNGNKKRSRRRKKGKERSIVATVCLLVCGFEVEKRKQEQREQKRKSINSWRMTEKETTEHVHLSTEDHRLISLVVRVNMFTFIYIFIRNEKDISNKNTDSLCLCLSLCLSVVAFLDE
jgi:hypothetical protein